MIKKKVMICSVFHRGSSWSQFPYRALIITEKALATMAPHYGTVYHAI